VTRKIAIGKLGESLAAEFLTSKGVKILARNVRSRYGELDIIGSLHGQLIIFEVRTRTSDILGYPEDSINERKRAHLMAAAEAYVQTLAAGTSQWRIDVLAIRLQAGSGPEIEWFENAVS
jgi:putative endonuclease